MNRGRDQSGASLVVVLAFVAFVSAIVPAVLGMSITGLRISGASSENRNELYAAGSALEVAIARGVTDATIGSSAGDCPETRVVIGGLDVVVGCRGQKIPADSCHVVDRVVAYLAEARKPGQSEVLASVAAEVYYQRDSDGLQNAVVSQWDTSATGFLEPGQPPCDTAATTTTPAPTTTTTTTTTTTQVPKTTTTTTAPVTTTTTAPSTTTSAPTTTTTAPVQMVTARWSDSSVSSRGKRWRAEGTLAIVDESAAPVKGAQVSVVVEYLDAAGRWRPERTLRRTTDGDGAVEMPSRWYAVSGNKSASEIRLTVTDVTDPSRRPWNPTAFPVALTLLAP